jgi:hypothetical protein
MLLHDGRAELPTIANITDMEKRIFKKWDGGL